MVAVIGKIDDSEVMARIAASGRSDSGSLVVISVEEIRNRVGGRWPMKQRTVWDFAQREFKQRFHPFDHIVALSDCWYLLAQPDQPPAAAQGRAINFLRDILQFFLGENVLPALSVGRVVQINDGVVTQQPLTAEELLVAQRAVPRETAGPSLRTAPSMEAVSTQAHPPLPAAVTGAAAKFIVDFALHPVWSQKKNAIVSYRMKPTVCEATPDGLLRGVDPNQTTIRELIGIDLIILDKAITLLAGAAPYTKFGLYVPLHISTMNSTIGRQAVFSRLSATRPDICKQLVISLKGLAGVPRVVLDTAVGTLLPFVLGVVGQAPHLVFDGAAWRGARLSAISFDLVALNAEEKRKLPDALGRFAASAESVTATLIAHGVSTRAEALAAWAAGFTVLSGPFLSDSADVLKPRRFEPSDLYRDSGATAKPPSSVERPTA